MLRIVGDCNFADGFFDLGFGTGTSIRNGANPFMHIRNNPDSDYWIGNFECVCSGVSNKSGSYARQFRIIPTEAKSINHLDFYGVANNHVMQHGPDAFCSMVDYLEKHGINYAGTAERRSSTFVHQGKKVSVTVLNQRPENFTKPPLYWALPEYDEIKKEIESQQSEYRIIYVHWGVEFINYPYNDQKQFAHYLIDSGADLVVGMHSHVMQGCEIYKGKHIYYSLGNCVFNMPWIPTKYSLMVNVNLETDEVFFQYLHIGEDFFPSVVERVPYQFTIEYLNTLLSISEDNEIYFAKVQKYYNAYRRANRMVLLKNIFKIKCSDMISILHDFVKRKLK